MSPIYINVCLVFLLRAEALSVYYLRINPGLKPGVSAALVPIYTLRL